MESINLLPRNSLLDKYKVFLLILAGILALSAAGMQIVAGNRIKDEAAEWSTKSNGLLNQIAAEQVRLVIDPGMETFEKAERQLQSFLTYRKDWLIPMSYVLAFLPETAEVTAFGANPEGNFGAVIRFARTKDALEFLHHLNAVPVFSDVVVKEWAYSPGLPSPVPVSRETAPAVPEPEPAPVAEAMGPAREEETLFDRLIRRQSASVSSLKADDLLYEGSPFLSDDSPFSREELLDVLQRIGIGTEPDVAGTEDLFDAMPFEDPYMGGGQVAWDAVIGEPEGEEVMVTLEWVMHFDMVHAKGGEGE